jgi:photoactive yellow protein
MTGTLPGFDHDDLAAAIERLPAEALDSLPFGAIRLNPDGEVVVFSGAEKRLSGYGDRPTLGRHFFTQIAPCMGTQRFRGRIERALAAGEADIEFGWVGDFGDAGRQLRVRVQPASGGGCWIFMQRETA